MEVITETITKLFDVNLRNNEIKFIFKRYGPLYSFNNMI